MKSTITLLTALIVCAAAATAQFEGAIRMRTVTFADADSSVVLPSVYFKGALLAAKVDAPAGEVTQAGRFVLRGDKNLMWIIIDQESKYIEIPVAKTEGRTDSVARAGLRKSYTLTKTGQSRTIIG